MNLGGDPSQALIHCHARPATSSSRSSSVDLGQGMKTVAAQVAAETLGLPYREHHRRHRRHRHRPALHGHVRLPRHAPRRQRRDHGRAGGARGDARGRRRGARGRRRRTSRPTAPASSSSRGADRRRSTSSTSRWPRTSSTAARSPAAASSSRSARYPEPETGEMDPDSARRTPARSPTSRSTTRPAWSRCCALHNVYEVGRAINPAMARQQIEGGAWMGISHALFETTEPYYPRRDHGAAGLRAST